MPGDGPQTVQVLAKALVILDTIKGASTPLGVNEIAKRTSIKAPTAFRLLKTLKTFGWVFQDENDKYIIGSKLSFVTTDTHFNIALKEIAHFVMLRYAAQEDQAMNLVVRNHEKCFVLEQARTSKIIDFVPPVGSELPVYASATGKILLAGLSDLVVDEILAMTEFQALTKNTITDPVTFKSQLAEVRNNGWALDEYESVENAFCIAVPVRSPDGQTIAGLSYSGFIGDFDRSNVERYRKLLDAAANEISDRLFPTAPPIEQK